MPALNLSGLQVVIASGDKRHLILAQELQAMGAEVFLYGFSAASGKLYGLFKEGLPLKADVIILPLTGVAADGTIPARAETRKINFIDLKALLKPGVLIIGGNLPPKYRHELHNLQVKYLPANEIAELAILNAIPTAEGALAFAIDNAGITIFDSEVVITGYGRCARPLARCMKALGAKVTIIARKREALAAAKTEGFKTGTFQELQTYVKRADFIFNTVPALVLGQTVLSAARPDVLIVDIASAPGGTDFAAAKDLGLKAYLLPGIPGKTAPETAGKILAGVYAEYLSLHKKGGI
ncbi:MAG: dipicolinate synthase subunit DpsA [Firmicutes bacterium]|nr:dipicolinate synthase subunit DpsA [Bacillota bacterium]